jgi:hypothetical protein
MRTMRLWVACLVVFGLPAPDLVGQTPGGGGQGESATSQAGASRAARLQKERDNLELQKVPPFKAFDNLYYVAAHAIGSRPIRSETGGSFAADAGSA